MEFLNAAREPKLTILGGKLFPSLERGTQKKILKIVKNKCQWERNVSFRVALKSVEGVSHWQSLRQTVLQILKRAHYTGRRLQFTVIIYFFIGRL